MTLKTTVVKKFVFWQLVVVGGLLLFDYFLTVLGFVFFKPFQLRFVVADTCLFWVVYFVSGSYLITASTLYLIRLAPLLTYYFLRRGILSQDLLNINEWLFTLHWQKQLIIYTVMLVAVYVTLRNNIRFWNKWRLLSYVCLISLALGARTWPQQSMALLFDNQRKSFEYNPSASFRFHGFVDSILYNAFDNLVFKEQMEYLTKAKFCKLEKFKFLNSKRPLNRNVHLIVLESFVDPLDLTNWKEYVEPLVDDDWKRIRSSAKTLVGISPIFGGSSAAAEFELLCGISSFSSRMGLAFNRLSKNGHAPCLPHLLRQNGYRTIAATPVDGAFFNIENAYLSLGFEKLFLKPTFQNGDLDGKWLSNESFFEIQRQHLDSSALKVPLFDYSFAVGGHSPFQLNDAHRPKILNLKDEFSASTVENMLNSALYTTKAVGKHVSQLLEKEPSSLIVILGDHLPPISPEYLDKGGYVYNESTIKGIDTSQIESRLHFNKILVLGMGLQVPARLRYYEIPDMIADELSAGEYCKANRCDYKSPEFQLMGNKINRASLELVTPRVVVNQDKRALSPAFIEYSCVVKLGAGIEKPEPQGEFGFLSILCLSMTTLVVYRSFFYRWVNRDV